MSSSIGTWEGLNDGKAPDQPLNSAASPRAPGAAAAAPFPAVNKLDAGSNTRCRVLSLHPAGCPRGTPGHEVTPSQAGRCLNTSCTWRKTPKQTQSPRLPAQLHTSPPKLPQPTAGSRQGWSSRMPGTPWLSHIGHEPTSLVPTPGKKPEPQCRGTQLPAWGTSGNGDAGLGAAAWPQAAADAAQEGRAFASPALPAPHRCRLLPVPGQARQGQLLRLLHLPESPRGLLHPSPEPAAKAAQAGTSSSLQRQRSPGESAGNRVRARSVSSLSLPGANEISHRHQPLNPP